jgi:WD40 repeat protein
LRTSELPRRRERRNAPYVLLLFVCVTGAAAPRPAICATCGPIGRPELYLGLGHTGEITVVAWSPDGRTLATGARDHRVILWDVATARPRATLLGHTAHIRQIVWRPDGKFLATSDEGDRGFLWEAASGKLRCRLQGLHYQIFDLAWSPDGRSLAGGHGDGEAVVWDGTTGKPRWSLKDVDGQALAWSPDSRTLATGKGWAGIEGTLWDVGTGRGRAPRRGAIC